MSATPVAQRWPSSGRPHGVGATGKGEDGRLDPLHRDGRRCRGDAVLQAGVECRPHLQRMACWVPGYPAAHRVRGDLAEQALPLDRHIRKVFPATSATTPAAAGHPRVGPARPRAWATRTMPLGLGASAGVSADSATLVPTDDAWTTTRSASTSSSAAKPIMAAVTDSSGMRRTTRGDPAPACTRVPPRRSRAWRVAQRSAPSLTARRSRHDEHRRLGSADRSRTIDPEQPAVTAMFAGIDVDGPAPGDVQLSIQAGDLDPELEWQCIVWCRECHGCRVLVDELHRPPRALRVIGPDDAVIIDGIVAGGSPAVAHRIDGVDGQGCCGPGSGSREAHGGNDVDGEGSGSTESSIRSPSSERCGSA